MKPLPNNAVIVWDWNGTIIDDAALFVSILNIFLKKYSMNTISIQEYKKLFCFPVENYYKKLGFNLTNNQFKALSSEFIHLYKSKMFSPSLKPGVLTIIKYLHNQGYTQLVLSAQEKTLLKKSIKHYNLELFFDNFFGLNNNYAKSKQSIAKEHLAPFLSSNKKVLLVGDTAHDYEVASSIGADCCLVSWGHYSKKRLDSLNCYIAKTPSLLFEYIHSFIQS